MAVGLLSGVVVAAGQQRRAPWVLVAVAESLVSAGSGRSMGGSVRLDADASVVPLSLSVSM
jgi:hypothetical protein